MVPPIALNHLGLTVPDINRAIDWYGQVMGFRLIFRRIYTSGQMSRKSVRFSDSRLNRVLGSNGAKCGAPHFVHLLLKPPQTYGEYACASSEGNGTLIASSPLWLRVLLRSASLSSFSYRSIPVRG
jgi:catechol 2,3-dioxygenase-like lactoylglutathione lyase family enzyme